LHGSTYAKASADRVTRPALVQVGLTDTVPSFDFWEGRAQCIHSLHQSLNLGALHVRIEGGFGRPILMEQEFRRVVGCLVQIVVQATGFLARGREQAE
jgi:hypothetical protein